MDMHAFAMSERATTATIAEAQFAELRAALLAAKEQIATLTTERDALTKERDALRASHARLREELELLKRRIFIAKAERVDTAQLEMEFAEKLRELDKLAGTLDKDDEDSAESDDGDNTKKKKRTSTGRRNLKNLPLEEERVEISDPLYEELVAAGKAERARVRAAHLTHFGIESGAAASRGRPAA